MRIFGVKLVLSLLEVVECNGSIFCNVVQNDDEKNFELAIDFTVDKNVTA